MTNTMRPVTPPRTWDFLLTGLFIFLELLLAVVLLLSALAFGTLNSGAGASSTTRVQIGQQVCTFAPPLIAVVTIPWAISRLVRRRIAFWVAALGGALMIAAFVAGSTLLQSGIAG